jgi:tRNA (guanine37-N1)-methyltransferase
MSQSSGRTERVRVDVITIFPDYLDPLRLSLIGKARADGLLDVRVHDLRRWTSDRHRTVDDTPYGGGAGMVMRPEPWGDALDEVAAPDGSGAAPHLVVPTPAGTPFTQARAAELAQQPWLVFACGRYEGIDQRVLESAATRMPVTEVSLGDYVLGGGEVAALVVIEAVARLVPGVVGNADSLVEESHAAGLLEGPGYTKPPSWRGLDVPDVLLSGDHARIARWRRDQALRRTADRRPDLLATLEPDELDRLDLALLAELGWSLLPNGRLGVIAPPVAD